MIELKHGNPALAAGEKGGPIEYIDAPDGIIAFSRAVKGNKVVVAANFGVAPAVIPSEAEGEVEKSEPTDNRPAAETGGTPFLNLKGEPKPVTVDLDGDYTEVFTGQKYGKGKQEFLLWPGDYVVLTK